MTAAYTPDFPLTTRRDDNLRAVITAMRQDPAAEPGYYADLFETLMEHGTKGYYDNGCHCDWCVAGSRLHWRIVNRRRAPRHGSHAMARQKWAMAMAIEEERGEEL